MNYKEANEKLVNQNPTIYIEVSDWKDVWDNCRRIPLKFNEDGSVICILSGYELSYHDGDSFQTVKYPYWRWPEQKTKRLMDSKELWDAGAAWLIKGSTRYPISYVGKKIAALLYIDKLVDTVESFANNGWKWCTNEDRKTIKDFWIEE